MSLCAYEGESRAGFLEEETVKEAPGTRTYLTPFIFISHFYPSWQRVGPDHSKHQVY